VGPLPIAVVLLLGQSAPRPELVVLPPKYVGGDAEEIEAIWSLVTQELKKSSLGMSFVLNDRTQEMLRGGAREQAWDCGLGSACLSELGKTLGAAYVVAGAIGDDSVSLVLIDIARQKKIASARSPDRIAPEGPVRQGKAAVRSLIQSAAKLRPVPVAANKPKPPSAPGPTVEKTPHTVSPEPKPEAKALEAKIAPAAPAAAAGPAAPAAPAAPRASAERERPPAEPIVRASPAAADVTHSPAPVAPEHDEDVLSAWWFWTSVGAAVLLGAVTAAVLVGGGKGGPSVESPTGSISGTY
jgi:hypothetical protein